LPLKANGTSLVAGAVAPVWIDDLPVEPIVPSRRPALNLAALCLLAVAVLAAPASSEEYQCRRDDLVRRIEVQFADDADRLPCQVVYWSDMERPSEKRVPWRAENQIEFCTSKAREMAEHLQGSGWTCDLESPPSEDAATRDVATPTKDSEIEPAASDEEGPASESETGKPQPGNALLQEALARDIRRLDELTGAVSWQSEPDAATLGDLDGDGVEDGAVLLSHRDENGGVTHHLLAYLFDGTTFRPVARVNLEAYYQNFKEVIVEEAGDGGIEVLLHTSRAGDPACCPSGRRRATFELRDGKLVLSAESDSGA
jgi:hypothetical protein